MKYFIGFVLAALFSACTSNSVRTASSAENKRGPASQKQRYCGSLAGGGKYGYTIQLDPKVDAFIAIKADKWAQKAIDDVHFGYRNYQNLCVTGVRRAYDPEVTDPDELPFNYDGDIQEEISVRGAKNVEFY